MKKPSKNNSGAASRKAVAVKKKCCPTKRQNRAIISGAGITLVVAGPGTGKTFTLVHRVKHLRSLGVSGKRILLITFSNKAACEMEERIHKLCPDLELPWLGTSHGICYKMLEKEGKKFVICDGSEQQKLIEAIAKEVGGIDAGVANEYITFRKANHFNRTAADYSKYSESELLLLRKIYKKYQNKLQEIGKRDFADLLIDTIKLLKNNPKILYRYQKKFQHIIADELQDFTPLQFKLMDLLKGESNAIWCVGDDDQVIYKWLGANPELINQMGELDDVKAIKLNKNFRSSATIVEAAAGLITNNKVRVSKNIIATRDKGEPIRIRPAENANDLANSIVKSILFLQRKGYELSDIAILGRNRICWKYVHKVLGENGIPCVDDDDKNPYESRAVQAVVNYLKFIADPKNDEALEAIINYPRRGLGEKVVAAIRGNAASNKCSYNMAIRIMIKSGDTREKLIEFYSLIRGWRKLAKNTTAKNIAKAVIKQCGFDDVELQPLLEFIKKYPTPEAFLGDFKQYNHQYANVQQQASAVRLMTIHGAKGSEFRAVFLVGLEHGVLPDMRALKSEAKMEDERRLAYVAITRAMDRLYFHYVKNSEKFTKLHESNPSCFISELPEHLVKMVRDDEKLTIPVSERDESSIFDHRCGETVYHQKYRYCKIKSIDGERVRVLLEGNLGVKKVPLNSLKKLSYGR